MTRSEEVRPTDVSTVPVVESRRARLWVAIFFVVTLAPLVIALAAPGPSRSFGTELGAAVGLAAMSLMGWQFILTARLGFLAAVFPTDTLYAFHRNVMIWGGGLALAHPLILVIDQPERLSWLDPLDWPRGPALLFVVLALLALLGTSLWRMVIRLRYDVWRYIHLVLSYAVAVIAMGHLLLVNHHTANPVLRGWWYACIAVWFSVLVYVRFVRPLRQARRPWQVVEVRAEHGGAWTLELAPVGHAGMTFMAGQFAWLKVADETHPVWPRDNPFSMASSAERPDRIEFTIQEAGDFTSRIKHLQPGQRVYLEGPFGTFDLDQHLGEGYVFIAGGSGAVPVLSMLRTMADRQDGHPVYFFYGNPTWDDVAFREELADLEQRLHLQVVHVLSDAQPDDWQGETGFVTAELMARYLPDERADWEYFVCGPLPMIEAVEAALDELGVPGRHVHTENYQMA
ncbi:MAG: ferric reductase-like transmembrane domain-containing protein [Brooklawnia sp.]|uniref:ferredoxin reductase family protein n=1 Tax=Brooklawnia sp. TaxID=2699740 RepID=UPI003C74C313